MGRRKIEIKAIKDDRNRSVTFLKRKGGLFKKAHELSVLCSVDVAVFIFGQNKKLYEYSSGDMRELVTRYTYHGGPNEHKGPGDFSGGADDDDDEDIEGTPPGHHEGSVEPQMIPPHYQGQPQFQHLRGHAPSASPPVSMAYLPRGHTPQPQMGSRPSSRTEFRRPSGMPQPGGPQQVPNGYAFMPQPGMYGPQGHPGMPHGMPHPHAAAHPPYPSAAHQHHAHQQALQQQHAHQQAQQQHAAQMRYMEEQRRSVPPPNYPTHAERPPQPSPPQPQQHVAPQGPTQMSPPRVPSRAQEAALPPPPPPKEEQEESDEEQQPQEPQPAASMEPPREKRLSQPMLDTASAIKKMPQRKSHSIFTPIDEGRSILSQHLASFGAKDEAAKRSSSMDDSTASRHSDEPSPPPPPKPQRAHTSSNLSKSETTFTPPSRSNSLKLGGASRPRLKVQIPAEEGSEAGSTAAVSTGTPPTNTETAPRTTTTTAAETPNPVVVLPPPSPSASTLLSAGATGPPNPFARPPPQAPATNGNGNGGLAVDTPASALPSRYCQNEFLPSPSSFYPDWNFRGHDSNTLPSPLNFATPVVGSGPSFLRDDTSGGIKRKSPDMGANGHAPEGPDSMEVKRIKVDG